MQIRSVSFPDMFYKLNWKKMGNEVFAGENKHLASKQAFSFVTFKILEVKECT